MYQIIKSGSKGNCVIYHNSIVVDIGIPFALIKKHLETIKIVLLTHEHRDHLNIQTLKRMQQEKPKIRIGCCFYLKEKLNGLRNVDVFHFGNIYNYNLFKVMPGKLYHDVPNCFYRIFKNNTKIFHATDTAHLKGITAKNYDLYAIEHNYCEERAVEIIEAARKAGKYTHVMGSIKSHLSEQQSHRWLMDNMSKNSQIIRLHESDTFF